MTRLTIILLFFVSVLQAQQYSLPSQIDRNLLYVNPSYAGYYEATVASLMHRSQWVNMPGALTFQNFELHAPLKKQSVALGFQARHESIGLKNNTEVFFTYAHRIQLQKSTIAFGIKAGGQNINYGLADLQDDIEVDVAFLSNSSFLPNAGFGISYYSSKYFIGIAVPYFFGAVSSPEGTLQTDFNIDRLAYVFSAGGSIPVSESISLEPVGAVLYSTILEPQVTAILNAKWSETILLGGGYRLNEGIIINAAYFINQQFSAGYSYDYNIGNIGAYSNGSHELGLLYYFGYKVNTVSPRDF
jgi:type IX secretion system PorP/SprF family membrane protein